tara:strand:+ start:6501 stop:6761 length:261 start_codon:yes stop_codon:yes gene_type:complete
MPKERYNYEVLDEAMNNAYEIIMGNKTFDLIMEEAGECSLPFDIREEEPDLQGMIEYFIETEEYEKCEVLQKIINNNTLHSRKSNN